MSRRAPTAGTIFWGITLVTIGALLLARNLGYSIAIWGPLAKYWPVLIIAWGLLKFVDYFRTYYGPTNRAFAALDEARQQAFHDTLIDLVRRSNRNQGESMRLAGEYLEVVITK